MIIFWRTEVTVRICVTIFTLSPAASFPPLLISKNYKHVEANIYVLLAFLQSIIYLCRAFCAGGMSPSLCLQQMLSASVETSKHNDGLVCFQCLYSRFQISCGNL